MLESFLLSKGLSANHRKEWQNSRVELEKDENGSAKVKKCLSKEWPTLNGSTKQATPEPPNCDAVVAAKVAKNPHQDSIDMGKSSEQIAPLKVEGPSSLRKTLSPPELHIEDIGGRYFSFDGATD